MRHSHPLPSYRFGTSWANGRVELATRTVLPAAPEESAQVTFAVIDGNICDRDTGAPIPGQRPFTVAEYLGARLHRDPRYGGTVTVAHEYANADEPVKVWCRRNCQSESRKGFVFPERAWGDLATSEIDVAHLPEWDHPRVEVRELARAERELRSWTVMLASSTRARDEAIVRAEDTLTRRETAKLLNLSPARVQQLVGRQRQMETS